MVQDPDATALTLVLDEHLRRLEQDRLFGHTGQRRETKHRVLQGEIGAPE
jgi:hypothetical protein